MVEKVPTLHVAVTLLIRSCPWWRLGRSSVPPLLSGH